MEFAIESLNRPTAPRPRGNPHHNQQQQPHHYQQHQQSPHQDASPPFQTGYQGQNPRRGSPNFNPNFNSNFHPQTDFS